MDFVKNEICFRIKERLVGKVWAYSNIVHVNQDVAYVLGPYYRYVDRISRGASWSAYGINMSDMLCCILDFIEARGGVTRVLGSPELFDWIETAECYGVRYTFAHCVEIDGKWIPVLELEFKQPKYGI